MTEDKYNTIINSFKKTITESNDYKLNSEELHSPLMLIQMIDVEGNPKTGKIEGVGELINMGGFELLTKALEEVYEVLSPLAIALISRIQIIESNGLEFNQDIEKDLNNTEALFMHIETFDKECIIYWNVSDKDGSLENIFNPNFEWEFKTDIDTIELELIKKCYTYINPEL